MPATPKLWDSVAGPWRASDLHECIRLTRAAVDAEPYELAPRYLLAALYLAVGEQGLALLQYERLLPLAIGRGELFLALAAQRRLDELHPPVSVHQKRFHAMHQWFLSLARTERRRRGAADRSGFGPHVLVKLPVKEFARSAELCRVEAIARDPIMLTPEAGLLWVVLHGRVRWTVLRDGEPEGEPLVSEAGDFIVLPSQVVDARIRVEAETPAECLSLDPALFVRPDEAAVAASAAEAPSPEEQAAIDELVRDLMAAALAPLDIEALTADLPPIERPAPPAFDRPVPDPLAEPTAAVGAPEARRRETRFTASLANGVVMLGLAGTRVKPLIGALTALTPLGMSVRFRRGDVLQAGHALRGSVVSVHLGLADGTQRLAARVNCPDAPPDAHDPEAALAIELEFLALAPGTRARLASIEPESRAA